MRTNTFYIAASSDLIAYVRRLAGRLEKLGMRWHNGYDWTEHSTVDMEGAVRDLDGAQNADTFVFFLRPERRTRGGWAELGARIGLNRQAHAILNGFQMSRGIFLYHPCVTRWEDETEFLMEQASGKELSQ